MKHSLAIRIGVFVFLFSFFLHIYDLNSEGRTWDEQFKVDMGQIAFILWSKGDFRLEKWNQGTEHPMIAKYIYGAAGFLNTTWLTENMPITQQLAQYLQNGSYSIDQISPREFLYVDYDLTYPRLVSALFNSLTVILVYLLALRLTSALGAITSAFILTTTPRYLAMGRLATFESLSGLFFMITFLTFLRLIEGRQKKYREFVLVGIATGLLVWTRYNNISIVLFLLGWWVIWHLYHRASTIRQTLQRIANVRLVLIPLVAFILGVATWPLLWINFPAYLITSFGQNIYRATVSLYHFKYFYATTPTIYLLLFIAGLVYIFKKRTLHHGFLIWSVIATIIFYTLFSSERGQTRYIFVLYPVYAILAGLGASWILEKLKPVRRVSLIIFIGIGIYQVFSLARIHPYYLDYYAEHVGGISGAVEQGYEYSWWGEGQREAGMWLREHALPGSTVGLQVTPMYVFPLMKQGVIAYPYGQHIDGTTTYLVVSRSDFSRVPPKVLALYHVIYIVSRDNVSLVVVYAKN